MLPTSKPRYTFYLYFMSTPYFLVPFSVLEWTILCYSNKQRYTFNSLKRKAAFSTYTTKLIMVQSVSESPLGMMEIAGQKGMELTNKSFAQVITPPPIISHNSLQDCRECRMSGSSYHVPRRQKADILL